MAVAVASLFFWELIVSLLEVFRTGAVSELAGTLVIGFPAAFWLGFGAWRRTSWGSARHRVRAM
jgi:hypothetical protein